MGRYLQSGSRIRIHITLYKPPSPVIPHSLHTSRMTRTHQAQLIDHFRVLLFFIELNLFLYLVISTHSTCPASITITPTTQKEKEATESMGPAMDTAERGERLL